MSLEIVLVVDNFSDRVDNLNFLGLVLDARLRLVESPDIIQQCSVVLVISDGETYKSIVVLKLLEAQRLASKSLVIKKFPMQVPYSRCTTPKTLQILQQHLSLVFCR